MEGRRNDMLLDEIMQDDAIIDSAILNIIRFNPVDDEQDLRDILAAIMVIEADDDFLFRINDRDPLVAIENYFEQTIPAYYDHQFYYHFRMSREVFMELENVVHQRLEAQGPNAMPLAKKMLITIWILANPESYRSVAHRFGVDTSTTHEAVKQIATVLSDLLPQYVTWPTPEESETIERAFFQQSRERFPGIIGAIDGCHIEMTQPPHNSHDYYNRKGTHSIILQGTCDHTGRFIDVLIGRPGRVHDSAVLQSSPLYRRIMDNENPLIPPELHLLGDSGYPLLRNILTPFRDNGHLRPEQVQYNVKHASLRSIIERSFGLLKAKFRRLFLLNVKSVRMAILLTAASCTLHNFLLLHNGNDNRIWENVNLNNNNNHIADNQNSDDDDGDDDDNDEMKVEDGDDNDELGAEDGDDNNKMRVEDGDNDEFEIKEYIDRPAGNNAVEKRIQIMRLINAHVIQ